MTDRDSLEELYTIVSDYCRQRQLKPIEPALALMQEHFHGASDYYLRRRLAVCRMLIDLHLPVSDEHLITLLGAALCHALPGDAVPEGYAEKMAGFFASEPRVAEVYSSLKQTDYADKGYYSRVILDKNALMIRLVERAILVEKLYEWPAADARRFINETRTYFFPMCLYAREHYLEFSAAAAIIMEKMKNLINTNDVLLSRYEETENLINSEILTLMEENTILRARILELKKINPVI